MLWCRSPSTVPIPTAFRRAFAQARRLVAVPLGPNEYAGVVWGEGDPRPGLHNKLKDVDAKLDLPPLREELRHFIDWVADYTLGRAAWC